MQLYSHATDILHRVSETVVFAEGDNSELSISDDFLTRAENLHHRLQLLRTKHIKIFAVSIAAEDTEAIVNAIRFQHLSRIADNR